MWQLAYCVSCPSLTIVGQSFTVSEQAHFYFLHRTHINPPHDIHPPSSPKTVLPDSPQTIHTQTNRGSSLLPTSAHYSTLTGLPVSPTHFPSRVQPEFVTLPPLSPPPPESRPLSFCLNLCLLAAFTHCHSPVCSMHCSLSN